VTSPHIITMTTTDQLDHLHCCSYAAIATTVPLSPPPPPTITTTTPSYRVLPVCIPGDLIKFSDRPRACNKVWYARIACKSAVSTQACHGGSGHVVVNIANNIRVTILDQN